MKAGLVTLMRPDGRARPPHHGLAPRLTTLAGQRLGVLDNGKANADVVLDAVVEELRSLFEVAEVVRRRKTNPGMSATHGTFEDLMTCGAVVIGTAD